MHGTLPIHPRTGLTALGFTSRGPVWPVQGAEDTPPVAPPADPPATPQAPADPPSAEPKDETDWKAEARKWEQRAKENREKAGKLDQLEAANQSELEKAQKRTEELEQRAQQATVRAVRSEVKALADGFADREDAVLNLGDLARFVGDDGEVDDKAIGKELAEVLKRKPHLAKPEPTTPPRTPSSGRPTEALRPGAAPNAPQRASTLAAAIADHYRP